MDADTAQYLMARGIQKEAAQRFRLGRDPETGRLTIPYLTPAGPWAIKTRCIQHDNCKEHGCHKYVYDAGAVPTLFNVAALDAERVIVVEGELDAVIAEQYGVPAVAYPGASTWQSNSFWRWCFDSCVEVVVVADGDDAGRNAGRVVAGSLRDAVDDVRLVVLPDGHDTSSFIGAQGVGAFLERIDWL